MLVLAEKSFAVLRRPAAVAAAPRQARPAAKKGAKRHSKIQKKDKVRGMSQVVRGG